MLYCGLEDNVRCDFLVLSSYFRCDDSELI